MARDARNLADDQNHLVLPRKSGSMEYRIVRSRTLEDLEKDVNEAIADGWSPTGGPMNLPFGFAGYFQAMVKE